MKVDVHVHLAGIGAGGSGCWVSPRFTRRVTFQAFRMLHRIATRRSAGGADLDSGWAGTLAERVRSSELDRAVALGFDAVYDRAGQIDRELSQMVVPVSWVLEACRRHSDALLPGPSVNPLRADALERLDECIEGGAVLIKWLPSVQRIDPSDRAHSAFYRRLADAGVALLVHSGGGERTFAEIAPELKDVRHLEAPLSAGVTVICAHSGVPVHLSRDPDQLPILRRLLARYPNLWLDNSGMANPSRFAHLARLAHDRQFVQRTLYGSDYPVPSLPLHYPRRIGPAEVWRLHRERNPFDRDIGLKRALGYPDATLTRAAAVLNIPRSSRR